MTLPSSLRYVVLPLVLLVGCDHASATRDAWDRAGRERSWAESRPEHQPATEAGVLHLGGARIEHGALVSDRIALRLHAIGRPEAMHEARAAPPEVRGAEVSITRAPGVREWYRSLRIGLEQGVSIERRPTGEGDLLLVMAVGDDVEATHEGTDEGGEILLAHHGVPVAHYAELAVVDARARRLPAQMVGLGSEIHVHVDDRNAVYPIVVDPLLTLVDEATLRPEGPAEGLYFGGGVAIDASGSVAGIGTVGSIRIYERTGASWSMAASFAPPGTDLSGMVAIAASGAGDRILVGTPGGAAGGGRVYVRGATGTWSEEAQLTTTMGCAWHALGRDAAISADGTIAVLGAPAACLSASRSGRAFVFRRVGSGWAEEARLSPPDPSISESYGAAVAISGDGQRIVVGSPYAPTGGLARVYAYDGTWGLEGTLTPVGMTRTFGSRVAIDGGTRVVVAGEGTEVAGALGAGELQVFVRADGTWSREASLTAPLPAESDRLGRGVAISDDGALILAGAPSYSPRNGRVMVYARSATTWSVAAEWTTADAAAGDQVGAALALTGDASRALIGVPGDDPPASAGSVHVVAIRPALAEGSACADGSTCLSGFCTDGVCCQSACAGGDSDCQACSAALTGGADGTCLPLSAAVAPMVVCRAASSGGCDVEERCASGASECPSDAFAAGGTTCRASGPLGCDPAEVCSGLSDTCPPDAVAPADTACRPSAGACDPSERCDGLSRACPSDVRAPLGTECGGAMPRSCSSVGVCDGIRAECGGGTLLAAGTICEARDPSNPCDVEDRCDVAGACVEAWAPSTTPCGSSAGDGACDAPDHCAGMTGACVDAFLIDVPCRASRGACDPAEVCSGSGPSCPLDQLAPADTVCRGASDPLCDPTESCDGVAATCPADVDRCALPDAGVEVDGGVATDGGGRLDAGPTDAAASDTGGPGAARGCSSCAASPRGGAPLGVVVVALLLSLLRRRRPGKR
jgi:hypothetical protein